MQTTTNAVETVSVEVGRYGDKYDVTLTKIDGSSPDLAKYSVMVGKVPFGVVEQVVHKQGPTNRWGAAAYANKPGAKAFSTEWKWTNQSRKSGSYDAATREAALVSLLESDVASLPVSW